MIFSVSIPAPRLSFTSYRYAVAAIALPMIDCRLMVVAMSIDHGSSPEPSQTARSMPSPHGLV